MCVNGLGLYFRFMNEVVIRRSFLDRRKCVESTLRLNYEKDQEVSPLAGEASHPRRKNITRRPEDERDSFRCEIFQKIVKQKGDRQIIGAGGGRGGGSPDTTVLDTTVIYSPPGIVSQESSFFPRPFCVARNSTRATSSFAGTIDTEYTTATHSGEN